MDQLSTVQAYLQNFKRLVNRAGVAGPAPVNFKVDISTVDRAVIKISEYTKGIMHEWITDCNEMMEIIHKWAPSDWVIHRHSLLSQPSLAKAMAESPHAVQAAAGAKFLLSWMQCLGGHASPALTTKWRAATAYANDFCTVSLQLKMILVDIPSNTEPMPRKAAALAYRSDLEKKKQELVLCVYFFCFLFFFVLLLLVVVNLFICCSCLFFALLSLFFSFHSLKKKYQGLPPDMKLRLDQLCDGIEEVAEAVAEVVAEVVAEATDLED